MSPLLRQKIAGALMASCLAATPAMAVEPSPATLAVDIDRAEMLISGFPDARQPADLIARFLTIALALSDAEAGLVDMQETLRLGDLSMTTKEAVRRLARDGDPSAMTLLAAHLAVTPEIFSGRLDEMAIRIGGRATEIEVTVGPSGAPHFSGTTTLRDTARSAVALIRTFEPEMIEAFEGTAPIPSGSLYAEAAGVCALTATVVEAETLVVSAGNDAEDCRQRYAQKLVTP